jgi:hypothetical protein
MRLGFYPKYNTEGKHDATGAFIREAWAWEKFWGKKGEKAKTIGIDNTSKKIQMRKTVLDGIEKHRPQHTAFFCHGWQTGIQLGFTMANIRELAAALIEARTYDITIYGCKTASGPGTGGDGGFADKLADALNMREFGMRNVDAHTTAGHTTQNPYVRRFWGGCGGQWIVDPKSALWSEWVYALKTDLRFEFPRMGIDEIKKRLSSLQSSAIS